MDLYLSSKLDFVTTKIVVFVIRHLGTKNTDVGVLLFRYSQHKIHLLHFNEAWFNFCWNIELSTIL